MDLSAFEVSPELPISFALGSNLADAIEALEDRPREHIDPTVAKFVNVLVANAYQSVTAIRVLEESIATLRGEVAELRNT